MNLEEHAAVKLGAWLKATRQDRGIVKRLFAGQIDLSPSHYSEVEAGVVRWLRSRQEKAIKAVLDFSSEELSHFVELLAAARHSTALVFHMLFKPEQLEPVRYRRDDRLEVPSENDKAVLLNAVFAPLM